MPSSASTFLPPLRRRAACCAFLAAALLGLLATGTPARAARGVVHYPAPAARPAAQAPSPPENRYDLQGWLAYQRQLGSPSLPAVAHLFYRRGLETLRSGAREDGVRMLRGACQLDPTFLAPRMALLSHFWLRDVGQALMEMARIVDLAKTHFPLQHYLAMNFAFQATLALFVATLVAALFVVWRRREVVRHGYEEFLRQFLSPRLAKTGAWVLLALPYLAGLGLAIPTAFTMTALWQGLRKSERALLFVLVALLIVIPMGHRALGHLALPDHPEQAPFYGTTNLAHVPFSEERLAQLRQLTARHPENPFLHFSTAWMAYRGQLYPLAKEEFEATGRLWPNEPRIPNNLGNLAEIAGQPDEAERLYRQAAGLDPDWAMPHYNLGQLFTREFRYAEASEELARATSFDFDLVRNLQAEAQAHPGEALPAAWGWLAPRTFWNALLSQPTHGVPRVPPGWDAWFELRGTGIVALTVLLTLLGAALGLVVRAKLPVRHCSNCDEAVCRRCAARRRDRVYCTGCSAALREATTPEFARLLLGRRRRTLLHRRHRWSTALAAVIPGFGPILMERLGFAWAMLVLAAVGFATFLDLAGPFPYDARIGPLAPVRLNPGALGLLGFVYVASLGAYLMLRATEGGRESEPERVRRPMPRLPRAA